VSIGLKNEDTDDISKPNLNLAVRTLTIGGFLLDGAERNPGYILIFAQRIDEFGIPQKYCFALFDNAAASEEIESANIAASYKGYNLILVGHIGTSKLPNIEWDRFINLFGGPIFTLSPLETEFIPHLIELSHNKLPTGLTGRPDDLFEIYVRNAFEFIFACRVVRYGQDRRFESLPDGIALNFTRFSALYDSKAYSKGYEVTEDSMRQFKSYVEDFKRRYSQYFELNTFIVISGEFPNAKSALEGRSRELQAGTQVPLSFLTANTLGEIITIMAKNPLLRRSIDWRKIFVNPLIDSALVRQESERILKDKIIPDRVR